MKKLVIILFAIMIFLSGCNFMNGEYMSKTKEPELSSSPVNGVWKVEEIIKSESREPIKAGDLFYFNIDFFAGAGRIYVSPDFEITISDKKRYLSKRANGTKLDIASDNLRIVTIAYNTQVVAEVIPVKSDEIYLYMDNQFLYLKRERPTITEEEKTEIMGIWTERAKNSFGDGNWGALIGIKSVVYDELNNMPGYEYATLLFKNRGGMITTESIKGIFIKNGTESDIYQIKRKTEKKIPKDEIYLNGKLLQLTEGDKFPSNIFSIIYLSDNYLTIESHYPNEDKLSDLATYSTRYKSGLLRLDCDDIVNFSSDKLYDLTAQKDVLSTVKEAKSAIGIFRENGFYVLKSRIVAAEKGQKYNRDIVLSVNFKSDDSPKFAGNVFQNISKNYSGIKDAISSPDGKHIFLTTPESISLYHLTADKMSNDPEYKIPIDKNSSVISFEFLTGKELEEVENYLKPIR